MAAFRDRVEWWYHPKLLHFRLSTSCDLPLLRDRSHDAISFVVAWHLLVIPLSHDDAGLE